MNFNFEQDLDVRFATYDKATGEILEWPSREAWSAADEKMIKLRFISDYRGTAVTDLNGEHVWIDHEARGANMAKALSTFVDIAA